MGSDVACCWFPDGLAQLCLTYSQCIGLARQGGLTSRFLVVGFVLTPPYESLLAAPALSGAFLCRPDFFEEIVQRDLAFRYPLDLKGDIRRNLTLAADQG